MMGSILGHHTLLTRDYPSAPPTPPAPPAPPTPPEPPQAEPIAFSAVTRASLFGVIGSAISSTTLATITCADASMTIRQSEVVAGLTFSYSAGVLTIAGTPTGSTRVQRVVVSYVASDGSNTVRGSTSHEITLVKASEVLAIGDMAGASGRVGRPLSAALASPSANYLVDVTAHAGSLVPGLAATLAWTPAATSSGTLTLAGTPTQAGTYSLTVNYRNGLVDLGTSTHAVVIAEAYEPPAPAPAPAPAPTPPAPSPPPAPTPAPSPGLGPDPTLADVRLLMRFNSTTATPATTRELDTFVGTTVSATNAITINETLGPGQSIEISLVTILYGGDTYTTYTASEVSVTGNVVTLPDVIPEATNYSGSYTLVSVGVGTWAAAIGPSSLSGTRTTLTTGAVGEAAAFTGALSSISGAVAALDGIAAGLSVECMADIGATAWAALTAAGNDQRFCPVASYTATDGTLLWALGFLSRLIDVGLPGTNPYRRVDAMFWTAVDDAYSPTGSGTAGLGGIIARPAKFVHMAGVLKTYTALSWERASWLGGVLCLSRVQGLQVAPVARSTGRLQIGGTCPAFRTYDNVSPLVQIVPFSGTVDELRIKAPGQYADLISGGVPSAITLARRVIPWPNY